ncbi:MULTISPECIES: FTR1 family iron permease [Pasteurellaceae]|uniref:FTR1 family iron permease n=1 Tax=Pasteurella atlantica TaxID=2827233 RepID=A0AAW8CMF1_9PAST|nr:FTR1 family protein [Pasteurella atlantica]MBR0572637.1 FTR1 family iron permease [Pasteurella atlantica]MDP8038583.1 FTR1 family iron permease [Pasteurella atlantica]MDP8040675.1 FTR1 family iron permease [Pasteurella atlantica]MDP8042810.1 FTR1 family iron permease [Pasteurella atlantica]MDP8044897.1 FTR1 family iron permease [Pasteurella atlantica]
MKFFYKIYYSFVVILLYFFSSVILAQQIDYKAAVDDLHHRLDVVVALYEKGEVAQAKRDIQMAYFGVYEDLEGPIRINYSAQYSIELESKFGEIRRLITQKVPVSQIQEQVNWLKNEISSVPEKLSKGHQLIAEGDGLDNENIASKWQEVANTISEQINNSVWAYKNNEQQEALIAINKSLAEYYSSGLSVAFKENNKTEIDTKISTLFAEIKKQIKLNPQDQILRKKQVKDIAYQGYLLTQRLSDELPNLPTQSIVSAQNKKIVKNDVQPTAIEQDWNDINIKISTVIELAIKKYQKGNIDEAIGDIQDSYFDIFEASGYENTIGAKNSKLKVELEGYFTRIVSLMSSKRSVSEIIKVHNTQKEAFTQAAVILTDTPQDFWSVVIQSFLILLREGLEAMLVVAAITAYLVKNNHQDKMGIVKNSVIVGLVCSVITAYIFGVVFTNSGVNQEILEGITMLVAVVVLFFMSYWLLSKVEAHQWQLYLKNKLSSSLTKGSVIGLWLASFLAIYREGAETVLFYFALSAGVKGGGLASISIGIILAIVVLMLVFFIMKYTVVQLPLKLFFMFTGSFMYLMAFIFAGKGIMELVEGKIIQPTFLSSVPEIQWLGIYPYMESLIPQLLLILAAIVAWIVIKLRTNKVTQ